MHYRLIALDVDGTLLNDNHVLPEPNKRAIAAAYRSGAAIVLCTGRSPVNTLPLLKELGLEGTVITHNGAATVRSTDKAVLQQRVFSIQQVRTIIEYCRRLGIHYDVNGIFDMFVDRLGPKEQEMYEKFALHPLQVPDILELSAPIVKLTLFGSEEQMDQTERDWPELGGDLPCLRSGPYFIDVNHTDVSKGRALKLLAESWGIPRKQVLAIGNYYNDVEMLQYAGLGIAMANSPDGVKQAADEETVSNNDNGVYEALKRHCRLDV